MTTHVDIFDPFPFWEAFYERSNIDIFLAPTSTMSAYKVVHIIMSYLNRLVWQE